jgi:hypothetical protein
VSAGSPTPNPTRVADKQADRIAALLTNGTPLDTVITTGIREGWTRARVLAVIRDRGLPLDASGRLLGSMPPPVPTEPGALLAYLDRIDDPKIRQLVAHIRGDLGVARALGAAHRDRTEAAARMVAADLRRERLAAQLTETHRRTADHTREN